MRLRSWNKVLTFPALATVEADEPSSYADFTAHGDPTEIGEQGNPDKFADIEKPLVKG